MNDKSAGKETPLLEPDTRSPGNEELATLFKALAHPVRLKIIEHLQRVSCCICGEIVEILPLSQSTVSQHLKHLKGAGLIKGEIEGPRTCYCVDHAVLNRLKKAVAGL
jgi:DNA-binding transcriptional ArsR family regulator